MKFLSALGLSLVLSLPAFAQDAHEGTVRFKKEDRPGVIAAYDVPKDQTEDALENKLKGANLGRKHSESGYWKYEGVNWPEISPSKVDVYFNVERSKGKSEVSMMVSPGNGNFVTSATAPQVIQNMSAFLNSFNTDVIAWQQQIALADQQKAVEKANDRVKKADRETDRAASRQKKADREKEKMQDQAGKQQQKLDELQPVKP